MYKNVYNHKMILENDAGLFLCDETGKLLSYYPSVDVLIDKTEVREHYGYVFYRPCINSMKVPEGVTCLGREFFRGGMISGSLELPDTLKKLGTETDDCVFADTCIGSVTIPMSVDMIGTFAFGNSKINELVYPDKIIECQYLRQFKGAEINDFVIHRDMFDFLQRSKQEVNSLLFYGASIENIVVVEQ